MGNSPRRLSHITEKSADDKLTVQDHRFSRQKNKNQRRSFSSSGPFDNSAKFSNSKSSIEAVASVAYLHQSSIPRSASQVSSGFEVCSSKAQKFGRLQDLCDFASAKKSDIGSHEAQLGTPHSCDQDD